MLHTDLILGMRCEGWNPLLSRMSGSMNGEETEVGKHLSLPTNEMKYRRYLTNLREIIGLIDSI